MKTVAVWYPDAKHITYRDEEADEARQRNPGLVLVPNIDEVAALRRTKFYLTERGQARINRIKEDISNRVGVSPYDVTHSYSKKAGCSMCPCSPGFLIKIDAGKFTFTKKFTFHGDEENE